MARGCASGNDEYASQKERFLLGSV